MLKNGICVIVPLFDVTLCLLILHSLRPPRFPVLLLFTSQGESADLLVYTISSPVPLAPMDPPTPTPAPVPIKPPITQVYSWRQNPPVSSPTSTDSSSDLVQNDDFPIALCKGKH